MVTITEKVSVCGQKAIQALEAAGYIAETVYEDGTTELVRIISKEHCNNCGIEATKKIETPHGTINLCTECYQIDRFGK